MSIPTCHQVDNARWDASLVERLHHVCRGHSSLHSTREKSAHVSRWLAGPLTSFPNMTWLLKHASAAATRNNIVKVKAPCLCWGLDDHGVASHEGRGNLADSQVHGVVEGRDAEHNTQRHLQSTGERSRIHAGAMLTAKLRFRMKLKLMRKGNDITFRAHQQGVYAPWRPCRALSGPDPGKSRCSAACPAQHNASTQNHFMHIMFLVFVYSKVINTSWGCHLKLKTWHNLMQEVAKRTSPR